MLKQSSSSMKSDHEKSREEPVYDEVSVSLSVAHEKEGALQDSPKQRGIPVDTGWAWIVLFAAWCNLLLSNGMYRAFGVMFVEIQAKYDSTSSVTSLILSVMNGSYSVTALFVTTVGLQYSSSRQFIVLGGIIMTSAYGLSALAPTVEILILLQGCVCGISQGMIHAPTMAIIGEYFEKYRSIANCVSNMGASVGSLVFSVLIPHWIEEYAFSGTVLLLGGLMLQITVSGLLMRPISFYSKHTLHVNHRSSRYDERNGEKNLIEMKDHTDSVSLKQTNILHKNVKESETENGHFENHHHGHSFLRADSQIVADRSSPFLPQVTTVNRKRTISELSRASISHRVGSAISALNSSNIGLYASTELAFSSMLDITSKKREQNININTENKTPCACFRKSCQHLGTIIDCRPMKRMSFLFFIPCACFIVTVTSIAIYLPAFAKDSGLTSKECGLLITVISITDMCTVVFWGIFADKNYIQRHKILSFAVITVGVTTCFTPLFKTRSIFIAFSVIYGIFGRVYFSLYPVVLVDFLGLENLRSALGILALAQAGTSAILQPVIGLLRDHFKTYIPGMLLLSTSVIVGGLLILMLPIATRCEKQNDTKEIQVD